MDLTVSDEQIEEEWRQQIIVVAKHKLSSIERIDLENILNFQIFNWVRGLLMQSLG